MNAVATLQYWVIMLLGIAALALQIFAIVDAVRHRPDAYVAADKRTKTFWLAILAVCVMLGVVGLGSLNFLALLGVAGAGVYMADVRPALRAVTGRGGTSRQGPYGPW